MKLEIVEALRLMRDTNCTAYRAAETMEISLPNLYKTLKRFGIPTRRTEWDDSDIAKLGQLCHVDKLRGEEV